MVEYAECGTSDLNFFLTLVRYQIFYITLHYITVHSLLHVPRVKINFGRRAFCSADPQSSAES